MKQKNLFLTYFIIYFLINIDLVSVLKLKSTQMFGELNDMKTSGINLSDPSQIKDLAGLESMLGNVGTEKPPENVAVNKAEEESVKNELLKETMGGQETSSAPEEDKNSKTMNINENDIDKMIKSKEKQLEVNPNAALENLDELTKVKPPPEEETLTGSESCEEIKKYGKQRLYCEDKFLLKSGEEKTVNCMKNFCSICCKTDENCKDKCSTTHSFFNGHDPEEMFISVCSFENMGPAFKNFCGSMIIDDNKKEYDQCFTNFCFDCCSNELKITDFNDIEIQKCLKICKNGKSKAPAIKPKLIPPKKPVAATKAANSKPIELSDEIKKILESPSQDKPDSSPQAQSNEDVKVQDFNRNHNNELNKKINHNINNDTVEKSVESPINNKNVQSSLPHVNQSNSNIDYEKQINQLKKENQKLQRLASHHNVTPTSQKNVPPQISKVNQNEKSIDIKLDSNASRKLKNTKICEVLILNLNIDYYGKEVANSCTRDYKKFQFDNDQECRDNLCEDCCSFLEIKTEISFCKKQCKFVKVNIDESDISSVTLQNKSNKKIEESQEISRVAKANNNTPNKIEADPVKTDAPADLNEENDINSVINKSMNDNTKTTVVNTSENKEQEKEITELKNQMKALQKQIVEMNQNKQKVIERKIDELNKNKKESVEVQKQFVNELKTIKLSVKPLNNTEIFPHFLNSSRFKDLNFVYFKLIDSLCRSRYFKSCKETLCNDYCNDSPNLVNDKCFKDCTMFVNRNKNEDLYEYIIKRHAYYEAKLDVIDEKSSNMDKLDLKIKNSTTNITSSNTTTTPVSEKDRIESMIKSSKNQINMYKRKMMIEEKNLLGLYKLKRNKN